MEPTKIQLTVIIDADNVNTFFNLLTRAIEQGTYHSKSASVTNPKQITSREKPKMTPLEASRHAHLGGKESPEGFLVDTQEACKLLGVSPRKLWQMYNSGEMLKPIRIGRAVRWSYEELRAWVNAGCPPESKWEWSG